MTTFYTAQRPSKWQLTLAALSFALVAAQASAAPSGDQEISVKVGYSDINLSTTAGAAVLYSRIKGAARTVCGPSPSQFEMSRYRNWRECFNGAVSNAVATVSSPKLTALHDKSAGDKSLTAAR